MPSMDASDNTPSGTLDVPQHQHQPLHLPPPSLACHCLGLKMSKNPTSRGLRFPLDSLFLHMQYVAHPNPDTFLYANMFHACASRVLSPQPVHALDLFTEMMVDCGIPPTTDTYNATIFACTCLGNKLYVGEVFCLAKEMIDGNRNVYGKPAFAPDHCTFCAFLEGPKRIGDLAKVQWILLRTLPIVCT